MKNLCLLQRPLKPMSRETDRPDTGPRRVVQMRMPDQQAA